MPTRFDHAVIAVRDLERALERFQRLGFDAQPGGRHTGRGSHNALVRFGLDYLELLSIFDEAEAREYSKGDPILLDELAGRKAALVGYALATNHIEQDAERFRGRGSELPLPNPMTRKRPDGQVLSWRTLAPGDNTWRKPWPFLIQWDTPDEQRLLVDPPGTHPNGATGWVRITVPTSDLAGTLDVYQNQLELELISNDRDETQHAHRATLSIGKSTIELLAPDGGEGPIQRILTENGEGPIALTFAVADLAQTRNYLTQHSIKFTAANNQGIDLVPEEALDVHIRFTAQ